MKHLFDSRLGFLALLGLICLIACQQEPNQRAQDQRAADEEVAQFMERFEGRGQQVDASTLPSADAILDNFRLAPGLVADVVLSEPQINQPVEIAFDHRGRLWVVQYSQYPYPAGLKVTDIDHHIRMTFDKVPDPPPSGIQGADKLTFFEDTDGDGQFDKATDAISGLNIVTAVTWGRGKIWVLNPPYLLAYPDSNDDGLPDGDPEVCIRGFGLEDTHAVANSLCWGPDGWLYGATGSTTHQYISTAVTKEVHYKGQGIWRYHPTRREFEIFAEGGGNTFHVEIDAKGRIYSGTNGTSRGQYYKQGAYYTKNWGKHGPLTNDYAYGFLPDMKFEGERLRFTHAWVKYQATALPQYQDQLIAINPLHNFVQASTLAPHGSSFATSDIGMVLESSDRWFRPVDIKVGPDGAIYLADWSDSRLSHVNPRDDWHKTSGRVYRIRGEEPRTVQQFDLAKLSGIELVALLESSEKWMRQQAQRLLADRAEIELLPQLLDNLRGGDAQLALESLWAAASCGGMTENLVRIGLAHADPYVRMWTVRLATDSNVWNPSLDEALLRMSSSERHPEVISQLASSAKRMSNRIGLSVLLQSLPNIDPADNDNPLLAWWALEHHHDFGQQQIVEWLQGQESWNSPVVRQHLLPRLMQKSIERGSTADLEFATLLFELAPDKGSGRILLEGYLKGSITVDISGLPESLLEAAQKYSVASEEGGLVMQVRQGQSTALRKAVDIIQLPETSLDQKLKLAEALAEQLNEETTEALKQLMRDRSSPKTLVATSLRALSRSREDGVGAAILDAFPDHLRAHALTKSTALNVLIQRSNWANALMGRILQTREVKKQDLSRSQVLQLQWSLGEEWQDQVKLLWPEFLQPSSAEMNQEMDRVARLIKDGKGDSVRGKSLFSIFCGTCHRLHGEGNDIGPDLTGYDRQNNDYLITHTVNPDIDVREGYVQYLVHTMDDRYLIGVITERTTQAVAIKPYLDQAVTFSMDKVEKLEPLTSSMMPSGLLSDLPADQVRDLFAYLQSNVSEK